VIPLNDIVFESQTTDDSKQRLQPRQKYPLPYQEKSERQNFQGHLFNENTTLGIGS